LRQTRTMFVGVAFLLAGYQSQLAPAPPLAFRDAWKIAASLYPEAASERAVLVWFATAKVSPSILLARPDDSRDWKGSGPFWLHVHRAGHESSAAEPGLLDVQFVSDGEGRLRSLAVAQCELVDVVGLEQLSTALSSRRATSADVEESLRARFATFPPSRPKEAAAEFRRALGGLAAVLGSIQIAEIRFGSAPNRDPLDMSVSLYWVVEGTRGAERVTALFEPVGGRLFSLDISQ
jgi:hypothetical protein